METIQGAINTILMKTIATILLFAPLAFELIQDYIQIEHGRGDEKDRGKGWIDWMIRVALTGAATGVGITAGYDWWKPPMMCAVIFFVGFNYGLNLARGKNIFYLGQNPLDRFEAMVFPGWRGLVVRAIVLAAALAVYLT